MLFLKFKEWHMYMYLRDEEGRSKQGQTNNKAKQHSTPRQSHYVIHYITVQTVFETGHSLLEVLY